MKLNERKIMLYEERRREEQIMVHQQLNRDLYINIHICPERPYQVVEQ